jgi:quercetin dioxygenase-like cupin family protein
VESPLDNHEHATTSAPAEAVQTELIAKGTTGTESLVLQRVTIPPGGRTVWHRHPGVQYVIVHSGQLRRDSDEADPVRARSGEAIIEPPGDIHLGCSRGDEPVVLWVLSVIPEGTEVAIPADPPHD